ncbi:protein ATP6V1FNB-like [Sitophilus oryzae]|uniref:Protein ATP6V1FNB-like n=1 Tax=Sitophilus oryzae TaxID=7048 RepID=A0A6J2XDV1_SITOR|nr:protein ATP6V1FNB-like [Sitophilus oryzae]
MSKSERVAMGQDWATNIAKEAGLRAKWFKVNEKRLNEIANSVPSRVVPDEIKEEMKQNRIRGFQDLKKYPRIKTEEQVPEFTGNLQEIMKPVDPAVKKLIYTGSNKDGRLNYLHKRIKLLPEDRFYFPEVSSFEYGWKMWNYVKTIKKTGFGRQQVIQDTFYRRRGVERDPEWYKEPAHIRPTFCNSCI